MSKIEWTEATWNPVVGCTIVSPGCTNCYAMRAAWRLSHNPNTPQYHGTAKLVNGKPVWTGKMHLVKKVLAAPLRRKKPTTYFVNSMGDLFHEDVPDDWIDQVFAVMALCPQHTFQVLSKRADRMRAYISNTKDGICRLSHIGLTPEIDDPLYQDVQDWPLTNVWLGVSVEDQHRADARIPALLDTPAAIRFVSAEPLLGPVDLTALDFHGWEIDALEGTCTAHTTQFAGMSWVIAGGESGPGARPSHPDWFRSLRDQCAGANVPFFFKQWGEHIGGGRMQNGWNYFQNNEAGPGCSHDWKDGSVSDRVGKKDAGRTLDGVIHN